MSGGRRSEGQHREASGTADKLVAAISAAVTSEEWAQAAEAEQVVVSIMDAMRQCPDGDRHHELVAWARSQWWHPMLTLATGWQGALAREAARALRRALQAETPGKRWDDCDPAIGRASITRLLGVVDLPGAAYATAPFRTWTDDDGVDWVAAAIGTPQCLDADAAGRWMHLDVRDVILWNPRTNAAQLAGEHRSVSTFVMPDHSGPELTVWGDCAAFFRAWAARRLETTRLSIMQASGSWAHPVLEPADGNMPGALLIGSVDAARWPGTSATSVVAADGVDSEDLYACALRAAGVPHFAAAIH